MNQLKPKTLAAAMFKAKEQTNENGKPVHVIYTDGEGFEIVPHDFKLNRSYYHNAEGEKKFFHFAETVHPELKISTV